MSMAALLAHFCAALFAILAAYSASIGLRDDAKAEVCAALACVAVAMMLS